MQVDLGEHEKKIRNYPSRIDPSFGDQNRPKKLTGRAIGELNVSVASPPMKTELWLSKNEKKMAIQTDLKSECSCDMCEGVVGAGTVHKYL